ncbi:hypothetical protein ILYODFUR_004229 [Ilyodon furcidens]|uniref:Uncharacterized protein n=1 Tax=Ilyodon furcidens TaxID=33524 RepID=A0ABV0TJV6_9TELE
MGHESALRCSRVTAIGTRTTIPKKPCQEGYTAPTSSRRRSAGARWSVDIMSTEEQGYPGATLLEAGPESLRVEIERLSRELSETTSEKIQAAEYGLAVLEEKQQLKQQYDDLEIEYEAVRQELDHLKESLQSTCRRGQHPAAKGRGREGICWVRHSDAAQMDPN